MPLEEKLTFRPQLVALSKADTSRRFGKVYFEKNREQAFYLLLEIFTSLRRH